MRKKSWVLMSLSAVLLLGSANFADAETLRGALAKAYANNHDLNVARAQLRAMDKGDGTNIVRFKARGGSDDAAS